MLPQVSEKIAIYIGNQIDASAEDVEVYRYGLEIVLGVVIKGFIYLGIALLLDVLWEMLCVLTVFMSFRILSGGVHFSTYLRCLVSGLFIITGITLSAKMIVLNVETYYLLLGLSTISILFITKKWVPARSEQSKIVSQSEQNKYKCMTYLLTTIWVLSVVVSLNTVDVRFTSALLLAAITSISLATPAGYSLINNIDLLLNKK